jgi:hypothetical protein
MYLISALIIGIVCGAIPVIIGTAREEMEIGMFGFIASVVSAVILGVYLAGPVAALFVFFILRRVYAKSAKRVIAEVIPFPQRREA